MAALRRLAARSARLLFVLDQLPLNRADLKRLAAEVLADGAVLVGADSSAPDSLPDLTLSGLPRAEAIALYKKEARLDDPTPDTIALLERLCDALDCLPLPLLLAARLVRNEAATLRQLVDVLEEQLQPHAPTLERAVGQGEPAPAQPTHPTSHRTADDEALARAVRLALIALNDEEQAVLAALVRCGGPDARVDTLAEMSRLPATAVEDALAWLTELRLVEGESGRYAIPFARLRRTLDRLLRPGEERKRAAAFFAAGAITHAGNLAWLGAERGNLLAALQTLLAQGQAAQAGALAQAIQPLLVLRGLWGSWGRAIDWAMQAAQATGDRALQAWALHERGTRAGLLGEFDIAATNLDAARRLRQRLGDQAGAAASRHNMAYLDLLPPVSPARAWWRRLPRRAVMAVAAMVILLGAGVFSIIAQANRAPVAVAAARSGSGRQEIIFDASGSSDPDTGDTLTYRWEFGDGTISGETASATISHAYAAAGTYTATLEVRDTHGNIATHAVTLQIAPNPRAAVLDNTPTPTTTPTATPTVTPSPASAPTASFPPLRCRPRRQPLEQSCPHAHRQPSRRSHRRPNRPSHPYQQCPRHPRRP